jgi:hypothetical protein
MPESKWNCGLGGIAKNQGALSQVCSRIDIVILVQTRAITHDDASGSIGSADASKQFFSDENGESLFRRVFPLLQGGRQKAKYAHDHEGENSDGYDYFH